MTEQNELKDKILGICWGYLSTLRKSINGEYKD